MARLVGIHEIELPKGADPVEFERLRGERRATLGSYRLPAQRPVTQEADSSTHPWREPLVSHSHPTRRRL